MLNENEKKVLNCFTEDCFYEEELESILWTDCFLDTIKDNTGFDNKISRGYLGQLDKKGFLVINGKGRESTVSLGEKGIEYFSK